MITRELEDDRILFLSRNNHNCGRRSLLHVVDEKLNCRLLGCKDGTTLKVKQESDYSRHSSMLDVALLREQEWMQAYVGDRCLVVNGRTFSLCSDLSYKVHSPDSTTLTTASVYSVSSLVSMAFTVKN